MKKILYGATAVALVVTLSIGVGCKKDSPVDCAAQVNKVTAAQTAYATNDSKANCDAYKSALQDYLNGCGSSLGSSERASFQSIVDDMTCP